MIPKITKADWPFILFLLLCLFLLSGTAIYYLSGKILLLILILFFGFFILLTQVNYYNLVSRKNEHNIEKIQALIELNSLLDLKHPLPFMTGWAAAPVLAITILKCIQECKPNLIVEMGSGVTTIISAYGLNQVNPQGTVVSFDHDPVYAKKTKDNLLNHKLDHFCKILTAPLKEIEVDGESYLWYDIKKMTFDRKIDLLIIDGPPVESGKNARYPALPVLFKFLSDNAIILLDDSKRKEESRIVQQWKQKYPTLDVTQLYTEKGITILKNTPEVK